MEFENWFQNHFDDEIIEKHCHASTDRAAIKVAMKKLAQEAWDVSQVVAQREYDDSQLQEHGLQVGPVTLPELTQSCLVCNAGGFHRPYGEFCGARP